MNQFKIKATKYTEKGALSNEYSVFYFGTADLAHAKFDELTRQMQTDENGTTTFKAYKVELFTLSYRKVDDVSAFWAALE